MVCLDEVRRDIIVLEEKKPNGPPMTFTPFVVPSHGHPMLGLTDQEVHGMERKYFSPISFFPEQVLVPHILPWQ